MLVLDANILIRAVLGQKVPILLKTYSERVSMVAPSSAYEEAADNLPEILRKRRAPVAPALDRLESLKELVQPVSLELYSDFEETARRRLKGRDEDDWPVLALALAYNFHVWTEDPDFFGTGIPTWTSNRVELFLDEIAAAVDDSATAED